MKNPWSSILAEAALTLDTEFGEKNTQMSHIEDIVLPISMSTWDALLREIRLLLREAYYPLETGSTRMPEVINRPYGVDFLSLVPESNTRMMQ